MEPQNLLWMTSLLRPQLEEEEEAYLEAMAPASAPIRSGQDRVVTDMSLKQKPWEGNPEPGAIPFDQDEASQERKVCETATGMTKEMKEADEAERMLVSPEECSSLLLRFANKHDAAAGEQLANDWPINRHRVECMATEKVHVRCAGLIRADDSPPRSKRLAMKILANMTKISPLHVLKERACAVSVGGGFVTDGDADTVSDACWILCEAVRREYWGHMFEVPAVYERIGAELFTLCCALDGPRVERTPAQERLVPKMFELTWRLREHRYSQGFVKLHSLDVCKSVLTAAISYMFDKRAYPDPELHKHPSKPQKMLPYNPDTRHRLDGPASGVYPTGLDCAMRVLVGFCEIDFERVTKNDSDDSAHRRLSRCADAARTVRCTGPLNDNETITVELLVHTAMQVHINQDQLDNMRAKVEQQAAKIGSLSAVKSSLAQKDSKVAATVSEAKQQPADSSSAASSDHLAQVPSPTPMDHSAD